MKILIAPDKFKSSLSAIQVANAIANEMGHVNIESCPLADGGEGTLGILNQNANYEKIVIQTQDPLERKIEAYYLKKDKNAYFELAIASGLTLINENERDILHSNTNGTGILIKDAISKGAKNIFLFLGGSATNDAGMGILYELGVRFYDKSGDELMPSGKNTSLIWRIDRHVLFTDFQDVNFTVLADVDNPFFGLNGAAQVYAKQKGASVFEIEILELGLMNFAANVSLECYVDITDVKGSGAAGGVAGGLHGVLNAKIENGFDFISKMVNLETKISNADVIISGEGQLDESSLNGKVVSGVAKLAMKYNKSLVLIVGNNDLESRYLDFLQVKKVYSILERAKNIDDALHNAEKYLNHIGRDFCRKFCNNGRL